MEWAQFVYNTLLFHKITLRYAKMTGIEIKGSKTGFGKKDEKNGEVKIGILSSKSSKDAEGSST